MTLMHLIRRPVKLPKPCGSDAYYWVVGTGATRLTCGPHLVAMMNRMRREGEDPHVPPTEPPPGKRCEWIPTNIEGYDS